MTKAKDPEVVAAQEASAITCDNHPDRNASNFTGTPGSFSVNLCDECTPRWFKNK